MDDCYEILQLSCNADLETIHRVFRLLAQRYHPDNRDTGNTESFRQIKEAYDVLRDSERRAAYDAQLADRRKGRFKIFQTWQNSQGVEAEKRKRSGILALLYGKRLTDPHEPCISVKELEDMLGCPREHLEFSLWVLKENKLITRSDNNRVAITYEGVAVVEVEESRSVRTSFPRLPAGSNSPKETINMSVHKDTMPHLV